MESMEKEDIDKLERIGKNFTSKIKGLEKLRKLKMYSMKEGEIYMIIYIYILLLDDLIPRLGALFKGAIWVKQFCVA